MVILKVTKSRLLLSLSLPLKTHFLEKPQEGNGWGQIDPRPAFLGLTPLKHACC